MSPVVSFAILCWVGVLCFMSYNLVRMPALSLFAQSLGAGPEQIGLIVSLSTLTGVVLKFPSGALSDLFGRQILMRVGVVAFGLPAFFYPFVGGVGALAGLRSLHGVATAVYGPSALAAVAALFPQRRGAALGWYTASTQAGALLGPVMGGVLIDRAGFSATFLTAGVIGCVGVSLLFTLPREAPLRGSSPRRLRTVLAEIHRGLRAAAGNERVIATSLADGAKMIANGALMAFLPVYGLMIGLAVWQVGLLFGVQGLTSLLCKPLMGRISDRVGRMPLILGGLTFCGAGSATLPYMMEFMPLLLVATAFGYGEAVVSSSTSALVADISEQNTLGAGLGLQGTIGDIGHACGPLLTGILVAHAGFRGAFGVIALIQFTAMGVFWWVMRRSPVGSERQGML